MKSVALLHRRLATILFPFCLLHEVIPQNLWQEAEYNTVDKTDAAAAEAFDRDENEAIQTLTCVRLLLEWGWHSGVSVESAGIEDRHVSVVLIVLSVRRKFAQRRRTASYSCRGRLASVFKIPHSVTFSWTTLTGFLDMTSKMPHPATSEWNSFVLIHLRFFPPSMDRSVIVCIFSTHFSVEVGEQQSNKHHGNSSFLDACRTCCRWKLNRGPFSASPSNSVYLGRGFI